MKVAISFANFEPWGAAKSKWELIQKHGKLDALELYLEDLGYGKDVDGELVIKAVTLCDLLATEFEDICEQIGLDNPYDESFNEDEDEETEETKKVELELSISDDKIEVEANVDNKEFDGELKPEGTLDEEPDTEDSVQYDELDNILDKAEEE